MNAREIIHTLAIEPHPVEGGYYRRTYTAQDSIALARGARPLGSAIYYLLEPGTFSEMHRLQSDEIFHFYLGDPVEMLQLWPDGTATTITLGQQIAHGQQLQTLVPAGVWQGTRLLADGQFALLGCTVTPGFDFADYTRGSFQALAEQWPLQSTLIRQLTRHGIATP